jgi:hypothetical protein
MRSPDNSNIQNRAHGNIGQLSEVHIEIGKKINSAHKMEVHKTELSTKFVPSTCNGVTT